MNSKYSMQNYYAVLGNPIAHSLSPHIHQWFAQQHGCVLTYEKMQGNDVCFEQQVLDIFRQGGKGLNITLPYKVRAFAMSHCVTPRCHVAKAANTLWMQEGKLHADNTDGIGFMHDLNRYFKVCDKNILLLGAGGAARGIIGPLLAANPKQLVIANRTLEKAQKLEIDFPSIHAATFATVSGNYDLMINATALNMNYQHFTLPPEVLENAPFCYDLSYQMQGDSPFVAWAKAQHLVAVDGLGMLVEQAAEAFFIWHKVRPETAGLVEHLRDLIFIR